MVSGLRLFNFRFISDELKSDPSLNHAHIRRFENYQLAEASKRRDEIKLIDKQMTKITKNIAQNFDI